MNSRVNSPMVFLQRHLSYEDHPSPKQRFSRWNSYELELKALISNILADKLIIFCPIPTTKAIISDFQSSVPDFCDQFELTANPLAGYCRVKTVRSQICNSDRRVLAGTKKGGVSQAIVLGHEGIGFIAQLSNTHTRNDLQVGDLVVLGPHFVEANDHCLKNGVPNLSCEMKHLGIHMNGVFADEMDFPEYTLNKITNSNEIIEKATNPSEYYDQMVFIEPLACVQRGYKLLQKQPYFNINAIETILILGTGPMGIIHAVHIQKKYPHIKVSITDIDSTRRNLAKNLPNLLADVVEIDALGDNIQFDMIVVATSSREANVHSAIKFIKHNGVILLFSGIDMKNGDVRPVINGIDIETVHRYEHSVQLINYALNLDAQITKSMYFMGTSGYVKDDFETSIQELHEDFMLGSELCLYRRIATSVINKLDGNVVHDLTGAFRDITFDMPAIIPLLKLFDENDANDSDVNVHNHLKILIRHENYL
ncbi:unnamed protein product [Adineta ricciae]|uniref:Alcohol dehydrogenase-like N-terminal domain-containing protein n=1 Tax=Adineta ricciae TaxID=249248 RepID=A0A815LJV2_ADIRI|nr:unnamed protein product [Adineta ricciae]CAF1406973.1 unnamed protein product [Adineta ricciae]